MADRGDPPVSPNKRKHIVWNEQNLMYNEQNKSAKMTIDEPDTPWASPPRELFEDPAEDASAEKTGADANRTWTTSPIACGTSTRRRAADEVNADDGALDATLDRLQGSKDTSEWDSSDDEADDKRGGGDAPSRMAFPDPGSSAGDERGEPEDFEAHTDADRELKARLFEAQRKSHQCTFRGVMARGKALLDEEDEGE
jgi:hypothetical protein